MKKLSKVQTDLLLVLADGAGPLHVSRNGPATSCWLSRNMVRVRYDTLDALATRGYIEDYSDPDWRWRGSKYRLTDAGKEAIKQFKDA